MKNLAKPLEWDIPWNDKSQHAYIHDFSAMYMVYEYNTHSKGFAAALNIDENLVWQRTDIKTIDAAKAVCQQHYAESLWDNLSEEARAILEQHLNK